MVVKMAGVGLTLVIWMGRRAVAPTRMLPKSSEVGLKTRLAGVALPRRLMKSRAGLESEVISRALMRVPVGWIEEAWGGKATVRVQVAAGTRAVHALVTGKSGVVWS